jgi:hypothetical protein
MGYVDVQDNHTSSYSIYVVLLVCLVVVSYSVYASCKVSASIITVWTLQHVAEDNTNLMIATWCFPMLNTRP